MTDFTLPNGNTLRIEETGAKEFDRKTGAIVWPYNLGAEMTEAYPRPRIVRFLSGKAALIQAFSQVMEKRSQK